MNGDGGVMIVVLIGLMIGAGFIAQHKKRRVWLWCLLTFLFGFFAFIPLCFLKTAEDQKICSECGEKILAVAKVCKHCGMVQK